MDLAEDKKFIREVQNKYERGLRERFLKFAVDTNYLNLQLP